MSIDLISDPAVIHAVSNIQARSDLQPDVATLEKTYVDTGVLPQLLNSNNQIFYGRRGTGKSHVLRVLGLAHDQMSGRSGHLYVDIRHLGSAHLMTDPDQPITTRVIALFRDLLAQIQNYLLDLATDPSSKGGLEEVEEFGQAILRVIETVRERQFTLDRSTGAKSSSTVGLGLDGTGPSVSLQIGGESSSTTSVSTQFNEVYRDTIVFAQISQALERTLAALEMSRVMVLIDEWTNIPLDLQPYIAEFIKRTLITSRRVTVKIASLEYRSAFSMKLANNNLLGFEIGPDIAANLDLDDYYVYDRNPDQVASSFLDLLFRHIDAQLPAGHLANTHGINASTNLRSRLFTEKETFVELVRAGEGVVRDFIGIFSSAFFGAKRGGHSKITITAVEEAARNWYETDKAVNLSSTQEAALRCIVDDIIGERKARAFMIERSKADHPMIRSLFDLRLLHLMRKGYSDPDNPGLRYNIYSLDYGTYVDLKRTKKQPELDLQLDETTPAEDGLVKSGGMRSIRRIILDPSVLDSVCAGH